MKKLILFLTLLFVGIGVNAQYSPSNNLNYIKLLKVPPTGSVEDSVMVYDGSDSFVKMVPSTALPVSIAVQDSLNKKLNISDLPANLTLYPTTITSDVSGYVVLVKDIHDPRYNSTAVNVSTPAITGTAQLISQRISDAGVLTGNPGVFNVTTYGNIRKVSGSGTAQFYFEVYHRDSVGTETLICTSSISGEVVNGTYAEFSASGVWDNGAFSLTDRIVTKTYANRIAGGSDPVYQLQIGGSSPVRTVLPVPFTVLAGEYEVKANKQNSLAIDGTGLKYVTVDGVNNAKNTSNGIAGLNSDSEIDTTQLPDYLKPNSTTSYVDIMSINPTDIVLYDNLKIPLTEPLVIGNSYRFRFKMKTNDVGNAAGFFTVQLRDALPADNNQQSIWTNLETVVGTEYIVDLTAVATSETLFVYCASYGGDIDIFFEKIISSDSDNYNLQKLAQPFKGQNIAWFGTSIPTGTPDSVTIDGYTGQNKYPSMVAQLTGATVSNEGVGGSRISTGIPSAYDAGTDPLGIGNNIQGSFGFYSSLSQTIAEKDYIFDNWATIYTKFQDAGSLTSTCPKTKEQLRDYSFERKLIANYLTNDGAKIFVLDHGFNDMFKIAMSDGQDIPAQGSATERMYYTGAMNYIIRKIYESDPRNKIVMITHYRKGEPDLDKLYDTQRKIADYWQIPLVSLADLMTINSISINTQGYWNSSYIWQNSGYTFTDLGGGTFSTNDYSPQRNWTYSDYITYANPHQVLTNTDESLIYPVGTWIHKDSRLNFFCPDNLHPHSDLSGISNMTIAKIISSEFNNGFQQSKNPSLYSPSIYGTLKLTTTPTISAGSYLFLTYNATTDEVEQTSTVPTQPVGTNNGTIANTAFVQTSTASVASAVYGSEVSLSSGQSPYTLLLSDSNARITTNGTFNQNFSVIVPDNSTVPFQIGTKIRINCSLGNAGYVTLSPSSGVTFTGITSLVYVVRFGSSFELTKIGTDIWYIDETSLWSTNASGNIVQNTDKQIEGTFIGNFSGTFVGSTFKGTYSTTATASTSFTVPIGQTMANTNYVAVPVATNTLSAVLFSVQNKTTTTFDIVVSTGLTGAVSYDFTITP